MSGPDAAGDGRRTVALSGADLTVADIVALATGCAEPVFTDGARAAIAASADFRAEAAGRRPVYGQTTGVGANRTEAVDDRGGQALRLLRSHATSAGPARSAERARGALAVRLNQLAAGGSGVSTALADAALAMATQDEIPPIADLGGIGTGDLAVFATIALALTGEGGGRVPAGRRTVLADGDALAFMSSNAATIADAALAHREIADLAHAALAVAAATHAAVAGNPEAFGPAAEAASPFPGVRRACALLRGHLGAGAAAPRRIQDPFALRALPQVHGALLDRLDDLAAVVETMANSAAENPVLRPGLGLAHHGGFHAVYLAQALDAARSALAQAAQLGLARLGMLSEPAVTGAAAFLSDGTPGASGVMMVEYVAADALARLRARSSPLAVQSVTLSRGVEEDASFAPQAARALADCAADYRTVIACELVAAVRCCRIRRIGLPPAVAAAVNGGGTNGGGTGGDSDGGGAEGAPALPADLADRDLSGDIAAAERLLAALGPRSGEIDGGAGSGS